MKIIKTVVWCFIRNKQNRRIIAIENNSEEKMNVPAYPSL
jgi:hypothetical protein